MRGLTQYLTDTDDPRSLAARARTKRWQTLVRTFPDLAEMSVIDLGGVVSAWQQAPVRPAQLTVVNLFDQVAHGGVEVFIADACALPPELIRRDFDIVYSNSVMDLVGGHLRRMQFAANVHALGSRHWIQTAYRYFPLDSYTLFPLQQLLPLRARATIVRRWPFGHRHAQSQRDSVLNSLEVDSLSKTALEAYFPDSEILTERVAGMVKSLIALKR
jgi:hypothetical protein